MRRLGARRLALQATPEPGEVTGRRITISTDGGLPATLTRLAAALRGAL